MPTAREPIGQHGLALEPRLRGMVWGVQSKVLGLPFNPGLRAHNVFEMPIAEAVLARARSLYTAHIAPRLTTANGSFTSGGLGFYVKRPKGIEGGSSDISWWSPDDAPTYRLLQTELFDQVFEPSVRPVVPVDQALRLYCPSFVVRSRCERTFFHSDFLPGCKTAAYTLLTPLDDLSPGAAHLAYIDTRGTQRTYAYRKGVAVVFGAGFYHGTQVSTASRASAFLCFTFGSDLPEHWSAIERSISYQSRLLCQPGGTLIRDGATLGAIVP